MAIWLFRRRSRRKRSRGSTEGSEALQVPRRQTAPAQALIKETLSPLPTPEAQHCADGIEPSGLDRRARTYSFDSGRQDEILVGRKTSDRKFKHESAPLPSRTPGANPATSSGLHSHIIGDGQKKGATPLTWPRKYDAVFDRVPTLHANKRTGAHLMSRKLSKRRKNSHDREREAELKALRDFVPVRPATDDWASGRPVKKETRRARSGLGFVRPPWDKEQQTSDVSLPIPESIHSSLSSDSEQISYKISALDALAPKPTLKYSIDPRWTLPRGGASAPTRSGSQKMKTADRSQIPEATLRAHKRVDDLADELNASDLRELMERDNRRRERKRQREQDKIERRLARRAEKERQAVEGGAEPPQNLERGVLGREALGIGINTTSAVVTSSRRRSASEVLSGQPGTRTENDVVVNGDDRSDVDDRRSPLEAFHRVNSIPLEPATPAKERDVAPTVSPESDKSQKTKSVLGYKKTRSKSPLSENEQSDVSGTPRKTSESSSRGPLSWTSFFKWGLRTKRSSGPSSFSNTSRDSMLNQPQTQTASPFHITFIPPPASGKGSTLPKRTRSRFREDLPELPLSPHYSQLQAPESDPIPPAIAEQETPTLDIPVPSAPININGRPDALRDTSISIFREGVEPSPEPQLSMSLASIDSEGSWLSGRLRNGRLSSQIRTREEGLRRRTFDSYGSGNAPDIVDHAEDSVGIEDDDYLHRVTSHVSAVGSSVYPDPDFTGDLRPSSDEDEDARWGAVGGQTPNLVWTPVTQHVRSREGLLNMAEPHVPVGGDENETDGPDSPVSHASDDFSSLKRATSVNLGEGHVRRISAGSAILLDISPRASTDAKRRSLSAELRAVLPE